MKGVSRSMEVTLRALALHAQGMSQSKISAALKKRNLRASKTTIGNKLRDVLSGRAFKPKATRKRSHKLNDRDLRHIRRCVRFLGDHSYADVFDTYMKEGTHVAYQTVRRAVKRIASIRLQMPRKRMVLTARQMEARLEWAKLHLRRKTNWRAAWFSDQKWWGLDGPMRRRPILQDKQGPAKPLCQSGNRKAAVSVWAAFSYRRATDLIPLRTNCTATEYCAAMSKGLLPQITKKYNRHFQERQTAFRSEESLEWQKSKDITPILFPSKCADINPIENLWSILQGKTFPAHKVYPSKKKLQEALQAAWEDIQQDKDLLAKLADGMTKRLQDVVAAKGAQIKR